MQRLMGGVLILTATTGAGYVYGVRLREYLDQMIYLRYIEGLIRGDIEYTAAPLSEIFIKISSRLKEPYRTWLRGTAEEMEKRDEASFSRIWNRCVDRYLKELNLRTEHIVLLKEFGIFLGQSDVETFSRSAQLYLGRVDLEIEKLRAELAPKKKLGSCLGVMGGIFLIVILL